jgi:hypothetical protein
MLRKLESMPQSTHTRYLSSLRLPSYLFYMILRIQSRRPSSALIGCPRKMAHPEKGLFKILRSETLEDRQEKALQLMIKS